MQNVVEHTAPAPTQASRVWQRVIPFIVLTFGLTWLLDLAIWLRGDLTQPSTLVALQLQMLIPAATAIVLGLVSTRYGSAKVRQSTGQARLFFYLYLAFTGLYVAVTALSFASPEMGATILGAGSVLAILSVLVLLVLRLAKGRDSFDRAGLTFGRPIQWLGYGVTLAAFSCAMTALSYAFGLGSAPDLGPFLKAMPMPLEELLAVLAFEMVIIGPLLGLVVTLGEEYGWRGFLQGELIRLGRIRGVLAVGIIWGLWHAPIIAMGHNYPGYPIPGIFLMTAFCVVFGFFLGYAVLKTGSVWLAAFLHALGNQLGSYLAAIIYAPGNPVFGFSLPGLYGLVLAAVVVLLILRDPIWKEDEDVPSSTASAQHDGASSAIAAGR